MTTLLLGGRGKTASRIASMLHEAGLSFLVASRSTTSSVPYCQAHFDWTNEETYGTPFSVVDTEHMRPITSVYLVPPPIFDLAPPMLRFVDFALRHGVMRFVLLSASTVEKGGPAMGQVHEYLCSLGTGIEYAVLRPTWFMGKLPRYVAVLFIALILLVRKLLEPIGAAASCHQGRRKNIFSSW